MCYCEAMHKVLCLFLLVAAATAAPRYYTSDDYRLHHPHHGSHRADLFNFDAPIFDTRSFWSQLTEEMRSIETMMEDFYKHFPSLISSEGIENGVYKIQVPLAGFEDEEISVTVKNSVLMIQAVHKSDGEVQKQYLDFRTVPAQIDESSGKYSYDKKVLVVTFNVSERGEDRRVLPKVDVNTEFVTEAPKVEDREEMEPHDNTINTDEDVETYKDIHLLTNEIPRKETEATTYPVNLKEDVEFYPIQSNLKSNY